MNPLWVASILRIPVTRFRPRSRSLAETPETAAGTRSRNRSLRRESEARGNPSGEPGTESGQSAAELRDSTEVGLVLCTWRL